MAEKYSLLPFGSGFMVACPGFQPAGHTCTKQQPSLSAFFS